MAKKYYWLKLKGDFFDDDTISFIEEQENGVYYINFYLKLCLKSLKTEGKLIRLIGENLIPYDVKSLAKLTNTPVDTVRVAMKVFEEIGLIKVLETGEIYLQQINELIGNETDKARLMREKRAANKMIGNNVTQNGNNVTQNGNNVTAMLPECYPEKEIDIEKEIEKELEKDYCTEPGKPDSMPEPQKAKDDSPIVITMPLNTGKPYKIQQSSVDRWRELYPAVDIMQELRNMCGWLESNRSRRKTKDGMPRFINNWLSKEQNRGGRNPKNQSLPAHEKFETTKRNLNQYVE